MVSQVDKQVISCPMPQDTSIHHHCLLWVFLGNSCFSTADSFQGACKYLPSTVMTTTFYWNHMPVVFALMTFPLLFVVLAITFEPGASTNCLPQLSTQRLKEVDHLLQVHHQNEMRAAFSSPSQTSDPQLDMGETFLLFVFHLNFATLAICKISFYDFYLLKNTWKGISQCLQNTSFKKSHGC